jgi:ferredoxin-NADP reductase/Na+-transporting NADH:ubiquinone oxidoreductase subunit NqrB
MPLKYIDQFLNKITMYRLVVYSLGVLATIATGMAFFGILPFGGFSYVISLAILLLTCFVSQEIFARIFRATSNFESYAITALILFFVLSPVLNFHDLIVTTCVAIVAIASKFVLAVDKKHIFNPAALGAFLAGLFGFGNAIWWVGSAVLLPFVIIVGFLIVRKIRRFYLLGSFLVVAVLSTVIFNLQNGLTPDQSLYFVFASSPLIFFGTVMLTEPMTTPPMRKRYMTYAAFVGVLYGAQFHFGPIYASPELALVIGNIFAYILSPKKKLFLHLSNKVRLSPDIYEFVFKKSEAFPYLPGQYLEWTMPHHGVDSRGNRRYFTIASSPTESDIKIGIKIAEKGSSFKKALLQINDKAEVIGAQLAGDFVLPRNADQKLVFIAGGIGITPFRSMIQYLLDTNEKRDIVLFYTASSDKDFVYKDIFDKAAKELGIKVVYVVTDKSIGPSWKGEKGRITPEMLKKYLPDSSMRTYYLSGPNSMVEGYKKLLRELGIPFTKIVTDYFPGF